MLKNNNGFTVIELLMSFLFVSILSISLFAVVINYRNKQLDVSIETELLSFKSKVVIDVQKDIQKKVLSRIDYCIDSETSGYVPRCAVLYFGDGSSKVFKVGTEVRQETIFTDNFTYYIPYISYGGIKYNIPDAANISIIDDYFLESSSVDDGIETGTALYRIRLLLSHNDLDTDIDISIVAGGNENLVIGRSLPYKSYTVGDRVLVQVKGKGKCTTTEAEWNSLGCSSNPNNEKCCNINGDFNTDAQLYFRVIENSNGYSNKVTLLYDGVESGYEELSPSSVAFNTSVVTGNKYEGSYVHSYVEKLKNIWVNAEDIRLINASEVGYIISTCPSSLKIDSSLVNLSGAPSWLVSSSYWTSSPQLLSDSENGSKVWYVSKNDKSILGDYVNSTHSIRPVITIDKKYVSGGNNNDSSTTGTKYLFDMMKDSASKDNVSSTYVSSSNGIDFSKTSDITDSISGNYSNGYGIYMVSSTSSNAFPIYYYRGAVTNNNVLFANLCWKIVRTTEKGGVKLIYNGVPSNNKTCNNTGTSSQISTSTFASQNNDNTYVGYMIGAAGATSYSSTHSNASNSTIKTVVDNWYASKLSTYTSQLEDSVWCNDRSLDTTTTGNGIGTSQTSYASRQRLNLSKNPSLNCSNNNDKFTVSTSNGNGKLNYPVGLLTSDEIAYAGAVWGNTVNETSVTNKSFYLYTGSLWWTMTPSRLNGVYPSVFVLSNTGSLYAQSGNTNGVRPSIVLKLGTTFSSGNGTGNSPYVVDSN